VNTFFGTTGPVIGGDVRNPAPGNRNSTNNGLLPASAYTFSNGRLSAFNFNEFSGSMPEMTRQGMFTSWERELSNPNIKLYGDGFFQMVHQVDELAPFATGNFASPGQTTIVIPARTPNPILTAAEIAAGTGRTAAPGAFNPFNPFNQDISGSSRIRLAEFGNRILHNRSTAFALTTGLRIDNINDKWNIDGKIRFSSITNEDNLKLISTSRLLRALNAADPIFNPASPSFIGTTTPYNPFGFFRNDIPSNHIPVAFATAFQRDENSSTIGDAGISATTGELFELPAGSVGAAFGADFRREAVDQSPDSNLQAGDILGATPASPIQRQRKIASFSAELEIPIFSAKHSANLAHGLSLNVAGRYEDFVTSKRHAAVPKLGLRWTPVNDDLVFRASWGKGFREPSLFELFAPPVSALAPITDTKPGRGNAFEPEQPVTLSGNPRLAAESTKSYNVGVVWSPKGQLEGFSYSMDVFQIERNGTVASDLQNVVDRDAGIIAGGLSPGESVIRDFAGNLVQVNGLFRNLGKTKVNGFDVATSYVMKTQDLGRFDVGVNATYLASFKQSSNPGVPLVDIINGEVPGSSSDDALLHWKGQAFVGWAWKGLNSRLTGTYTDGFNEFDNNGDPRKVSSTIVYDLQISYTFFPSKGKNEVKLWSDLKMTVGVNNLFDKDPPHAEGNGGNSNGYPGFLYNDTGRFVYVGFEKKL
jgi:outer membrane receptor protein involved in Fe transport